MPGFDHDAHALGLNRILDGIYNLARETLLHLQAPRENFDEPWNLAQPDHLAVGDIRHVNLAEEWQHVVLAQREHFYVLHDHHLVVVDFKERVVQNFGWILRIPFRQKGHRLLDSCRGRNQPIPKWIFAETAQDFAIHLLGAELAQTLDRARYAPYRLTDCNWLRHSYVLRPEFVDSSLYPCFAQRRPRPSSGTSQH